MVGAYGSSSAGESGRYRDGRRPGYGAYATERHDRWESSGMGAGARGDHRGGHRSYRAGGRPDETGLLVDDGIVMLGIVLGGVAGYLIASTFRGGSSAQGDGWRGGMSRQGAQESDGPYSRKRFGAEASSSVERDETTELIASNKVEGTPVYNRRKEKLGEIYNVMVGKRSGRVAYAVVSFGGFLGLGEKYHPVPWHVLTYDTQTEGYVIDADKERLQGAPNFAAGEEPFSHPDYDRQVRNYWSAGMI